MQSISVRKISGTERPLETLFAAARLCYGKVTSAEPKAMATLLDQIVANGHTSILEHCTYTFLVEGISRNCSHQIVRHRHMSFAQHSLHFTDMKEFKMVTPAKSEKFKETIDSVLTQTWILYRGMINAGVPKEEARHVLPSGVHTKILCTANLREWMQFIRVRACNVNCNEIKQVARKVRELLAVELPFMSRFLGPACFVDKTCLEGNKFCMEPMALPVLVRYPNGMSMRISNMDDLDETRRYARLK